MIDNRKIVVVNRTQSPTSTSKSKEGFFGLLSILVLIAIIGVVGYLLWKIIKVVGLVYLGIWFLGSFYVVLKNKRFAVKVGITPLQYAKESLESCKVKDINEDKAKGFLVFLMFLAFAACFIATFFLLRFSLDSDYQIFPVNLLGLVVFLLMASRTLFYLRRMFNITQKLDEEIKPLSFEKKLLNWTRLLVVNTYVACIFLTLFGIIGKA